MVEFPRLLHSGAFCRSHFFTFGSGDRTIWNVTQSACRAFVMISTSPWLRAGALNSTDLAPIVGWPEQEGSVRMVVVVVEAVEQVSSYPHVYGSLTSQEPSRGSRFPVSLAQGHRDNNDCCCCCCY